MANPSILGPSKIRKIAELARVVSLANVPGHAAEVGVFRGGVLRQLSRAFPSRKVYGFDTFAGLPVEHDSPGEWCKPGMFAEVVFDDVRASFHDCPNVELVRGLFPDTGAGIDGAFAFVHLDVDFYLSTLRALEFLAPRMSPGGVIVLDDWDFDRCPGVRRAVDELRLPAVQTGAFQAAIHFH
jgi:O-methyltransferase